MATDTIPFETTESLEQTNHAAGIQLGENDPGELWRALELLSVESLANTEQMALFGGVDSPAEPLSVEAAVSVAAKPEAAIAVAPEPVQAGTEPEAHIAVTTFEAEPVEAEAAPEPVQAATETTPEAEAHIAVTTFEADPVEAATESEADIAFAALAVATEPEADIAVASLEADPVEAEAAPEPVQAATEATPEAEAHVAGATLEAEPVETAANPEADIPVAALAAATEPEADIAVASFEADPAEAATEPEADIAVASEPVQAAVEATELQTEITPAAELAPSDQSETVAASVPVEATTADPAAVAVPASEVTRPDHLQQLGDALLAMTESSLPTTELVLASPSEQPYVMADRLSPIRLAAPLPEEAARPVGPTRRLAIPAHLPAREFPPQPILASLPAVYTKRHAGLPSWALTMVGAVVLTLAVISVIQKLSSSEPAASAAAPALARHAAATPERKPREAVPPVDTAEVAKAPAPPTESHDTPAPETEPTTPVPTPANEYPYARFVEVTSLKVVEQNNRPQVQYLVVNTAERELDGIALRINVRSSTASKGASPLFSVAAWVPKLAPHQSKEIRTDLDTGLTVAQIPKAANLRTEVRITSQQ
jgi:hypothetical protein